MTSTSVSIVDVSGSQEAVAGVNMAAEEAIIGYAAAGAILDDSRRLAALVHLFPDPSRRPFNSRTLAATEPTGNELFGGAVIEATIPLELMQRDPESVRYVAQFHYVLAAMFVRSDMRHRGVGDALLDAASFEVIKAGGRYLEGFVDERNESVGFYRSSGATVLSRNQPLPARPPTNVPTTHPHGLNGNWFYIDGWAKHHQRMECARCETHPRLRFHPDDGGYLSCPNCGTGEAGRSPKAGTTEGF